MLKLNKSIFITTLAFMLCAGVFLFPAAVYAVGDVPAIGVEAETDRFDGETAPDLDGVFGEADTDAETALDVDPDETESGIPPCYGSGNITPDGTGTVIDNVFIEGNGLEFFTFATEAGNVFYLVIDRMRDKDNVYFLNAVTEADLMALAEIESKSAGGTTVSGIPPVSGEPIPADPQDQQPEAPEDPPADKGGIGSGTLIFLLIAVAAAGGAGYYFKILRPKKLAAQDDEGVYFGDDEDEYLGDEDAGDDYGITGNSEPDDGDSEPYAGDERE